MMALARATTLDLMASGVLSRLTGCRTARAGRGSVYLRRDATEGNEQRDNVTHWHSPFDSASDLR